jgi:hypothetical protein
VSSNAAPTDVPRHPLPRRRYGRGMSGPAGNDQIDDVASGDIVYLDRGDGERPYRVVHQDARESPSGKIFSITVEPDDGNLFDIEMPAGTTVRRSLESKWESTESPTPHDEP